MPTPADLEGLEVTFEGGFFPSAPALAPARLQRTIRRGSNVWLRPQGALDVADGLLEVSSTNVGARLFAADIQRASIEGALVGNRLPYAGFLRYRGGVLFFVSEQTNAQVYLNEAAPSGLVTSPTAGRLRVAVPDGSGGYDVFDAGLTKPPLTSADVGASPTNGTKDMSGFIGLAVARWRTSTRAWGQPSDVIYTNLAPGSNATLAVNLPPLVSGQDGWIIAGTRWGDRSGELHVVRYVYINVRGTFTATNGSPTLTGVDTFWTYDLHKSDLIVIDGTLYQITAVISDTEVTIQTFPGLVAAFQGVTGPGKTMTIDDVLHMDWLDSELGVLIPRDVFPPPRAAGVLQYGGRVFLWGCEGADASSPTGPMIFPTLDNNPEHIGILGIVTDSGSDIVNVLGGDGPLYVMTTTSLEAVAVTGNPDAPFLIRIIAEPGFKAATNGVLDKDTFYGFNNRPLRTRADKNIDVEFAEPVWKIMEGWNPERVVLAIDPENEAVLFCHDDGESTEIVPWMTQMGVWGPPLNLAVSLYDAAVVNGTLYVTVSSGANVRVNQWEGGSDIGGTRYSASQYYDPRLLNRNRVKSLVPTGKIGTLSVYAAQPGEPVPDVSDLGQAEVSFPLTDTDISEEEILTHIQGRAFAFRVDFASSDGRFEKLVARGIPLSERR